MIAGRANEITTDGHLIEAGVRSSLETFGRMLPSGSLLLKGQEFVHSSAAARSYQQQLRCDGVEVSLSLSGRFSGTFALILDTRAAQQLVTVLVGEAAATPVFNDVARSALKEAGNIVASAFLGALESLCGRGGLPGLPALHMNFPCHDEDKTKAIMYALPMTLAVATCEAYNARGGIFISLYDDDNPLSSPA